jgi:hypothetical protein
VSGLSVSQGINNFSQGGQTGVNLFGLIKSFSFGSRFADFLTSCQVDKIQSSSFGAEIFKVILADCDNEEQVRSRRSFIHICRCDCTTISGLFNELIDFFGRRYVILSEIFDENASLFIRSDF